MQRFLPTAGPYQSRHLTDTGGHARENLDFIRWYEPSGRIDERHTDRFVELPVEVLLAREVRALVPAAHRDDHIGSPDRVVGASK
jgi:elongation factor P hydroxylase